MKINLKKFCYQMGSGRVKEQLGQPWSRGGFTYASNFHIIVRVPRVKDVPGNRKAPKAEGLNWNRRTKKSDWKRIPDILKVNPEYGGRGVRLGWHVFDEKYLKMIKRLPEPEIAVGVKKYTAVPFRFSGGEGILMPMYY